MITKLSVLLGFATMVCLSSPLKAQHVENFNGADVTTKPISCWYFEDKLNPPESEAGQYSWGINSTNPIEGSGSLRFTGAASTDSYRSTNLMTPFYGTAGNTISFKMRIKATGVVTGTQLSIGVWTGNNYPTPIYNYTVSEDNTIITVNEVVPTGSEGIISIEFRFYQTFLAGSPQLNFTVDIDEFQTNGTIDPANTCYQTHLPVSFGAVAAQLTEENLTVNWTTLKETNNAYFDVEASTDGKTFSKIGTLKTKAANGASDLALTYQFSRSASGITLGLGLGLLALGGISFSRRKKILATAALLAGLSFSIAGCQKSDSAGINDETLFIRIAQVDKDGTKQYSQVVKAVRK